MRTFLGVLAFAASVLATDFPDFGEFLTDGQLEPVKLDLNFSTTDPSIPEVDSKSHFFEEKTFSGAEIPAIGTRADGSKTGANVVSGMFKRWDLLNSPQEITSIAGACGYECGGSHCHTYAPRFLFAKNYGRAFHVGSWNNHAIYDGVVVFTYHFKASTREVNFRVGHGTVEAGGAMTMTSVINEGTEVLTEEEYENMHSTYIDCGYGDTYSAPAFAGVFGFASNAPVITLEEESKEDSGLIFSLLQDAGFVESEPDVFTRKIYPGESTSVVWPNESYGFSAHMAVTGHSGTYMKAFPGTRVALVRAGTSYGRLVSSQGQDGILEISSPSSYTSSSNYVDAVFTEPRLVRMPAGPPKCSALETSPLHVGGSAFGNLSVSDTLNASIDLVHHQVHNSSGSERTFVSAELLCSSSHGSASTDPVATFSEVGEHCESGILAKRLAVDFAGIDVHNCILDAIADGLPATAIDVTLTPLVRFEGAGPALSTTLAPLELTAILTASDSTMIGTITPLIQSPLVNAEITDIRAQHCDGLVSITLRVDETTLATLDSEQIADLFLSDPYRGSVQRLSQSLDSSFFYLVSILTDLDAETLSTTVDVSPTVSVPVHCPVGCPEPDKPANVTFSVSHFDLRCPSLESVSVATHATSLGAVVESSEHEVPIAGHQSANISFASIDKITGKPIPTIVHRVIAELTAPDSTTKIEIELHAPQDFTVENDILVLSITQESLTSSSSVKEGVIYSLTITIETQRGDEFSSPSSVRRLTESGISVSSVSLGKIKVELSPPPTYPDEDPNSVSPWLIGGIVAGTIVIALAGAIFAIKSIFRRPSPSAIRPEPKELKPTTLPL